MAPTMLLAKPSRLMRRPAETRLGQGRSFNPAAMGGLRREPGRAGVWWTGWPGAAREERRRGIVLDPSLQLKSPV